MAYKQSAHRRGDVWRQTASRCRLNRLWSIEYRLHLNTLKSKGDTLSQTPLIQTEAQLNDPNKWKRAKRIKGAVTFGQPLVTPFFSLFSHHLLSLHLDRYLKNVYGLNTAAIHNTLYNQSQFVANTYTGEDSRHHTAFAPVAIGAFLSHNQNSHVQTPITKGLMFVQARRAFIQHWREALLAVKREKSSDKHTIDNKPSSIARLQYPLLSALNNTATYTQLYTSLKKGVISGALPKVSIEWLSRLLQGEQNQALRHEFAQVLMASVNSVSKLEQKKSNAMIYDAFNRTYRHIKNTFERAENSNLRDPASTVGLYQNSRQETFNTEVKNHTLDDVALSKSAHHSVYKLLDNLTQWAHTQAVYVASQNGLRLTKKRYPRFNLNKTLQQCFSRPSLARQVKPHRLNSRNNFDSVKNQSLSLLHNTNEVAFAAHAMDTSLIEADYSYSDFVEIDNTDNRDSRAHIYEHEYDQVYNQEYGQAHHFTRWLKIAKPGRILASENVVNGHSERLESITRQRQNVNRALNEINTSLTKSSGTEEASHTQLLTEIAQQLRALEQRSHTDMSALLQSINKLATQSSPTGHMSHGPNIRPLSFLSDS